MRQKITFITDDGTEFVEESAARTHEARERFKAWYATHPIVEASGTTVPIGNVVSWLRENRSAIFEVLRELRDARP